MKIKAKKNNKILLDAFCGVVGITNSKATKNQALFEELDLKRVKKSPYVLYALPLNNAVSHLLRLTNWNEKDIIDRLLQEDQVAREKLFLVGREL